MSGRLNEQHRWAAAVHFALGRRPTAVVAGSAVLFTGGRKRRPAPTLSRPILLLQAIRSSGDGPCRERDSMLGRRGEGFCTAAQAHDPQLGILSDSPPRRSGVFRWRWNPREAIREATGGILRWACPRPRGVPGGWGGGRAAPVLTAQSGPRPVTSASCTDPGPTRDWPRLPRGPTATSRRGTSFR